MQLIFVPLANRMVSLAHIVSTYEHAGECWVQLSDGSNLCTKLTPAEVFQLIQKAIDDAERRVI